MSECLEIPGSDPSDQYFLNLVEFNVTAHIEVAPEVEEAAKTAITTVWEDEVGTPTSVNLSFVHRINQKLVDGTTVQPNAVYLFDTDTIHISIQNLLDQGGSENLATYVLLHAAHEARHKVQVSIGDRPLDSSVSISDGSYDENRHEDEAWQSAVRTFAKINPNIPLSFEVGDRTYSTES